MTVWLVKNAAIEKRGTEAAFFHGAYLNLEINWRAITPWVGRFRALDADALRQL